MTPPQAAARFKVRCPMLTRPSADIVTAADGDPKPTRLEEAVAKPRQNRDLLGLRASVEVKHTAPGWKIRPDIGCPPIATSLLTNRVEPATGNGYNLHLNR